jgi:SpoVK/Ycf46/Vps4 family AAA+-type ATPase
VELPERLKGCDPVLVERIENDIIDRGDPITFEDIAGLAFAKKCVMELVCWPMARPDIFTVRLAAVAWQQVCSWMAEWP